MTRSSSCSSSTASSSSYSSSSIADIVQPLPSSPGHRDHALRVLQMCDIIDESNRTLEERFQTSVNSLLKDPLFNESVGSLSSTSAAKGGMASGADAGAGGGGGGGAGCDGGGGDCDASSVSSSKLSSHFERDSNAVSVKSLEVQADEMTAMTDPASVWTESSVAVVSSDSVRSLVSDRASSNSTRSLLSDKAASNEGAACAGTACAGNVIEEEAKGAALPPLPPARKSSNESQVPQAKRSPLPPSPPPLASDASSSSLPSPSKYSAEELQVQLEQCRQALLKTTSNASVKYRRLELDYKALQRRSETMKAQLSSAWEDGEDFRRERERLSEELEGVKAEKKGLALKFGMKELKLSEEMHALKVERDGIKHDNDALRKQLESCTCGMKKPTPRLQNLRQHLRDLKVTLMFDLGEEAFQPPNRDRSPSPPPRRTYGSKSAPRYEVSDALQKSNPSMDVDINQLEEDLKEELHALEKKWRSNDNTDVVPKKKRGNRRVAKSQLSGSLPSLAEDDQSTASAPPAQGSKTRNKSKTKKKRSKLDDWFDKYPDGSPARYPSSGDELSIDSSRSGYSTKSAPPSITPTRPSNLAPRGEGMAPLRPLHSSSPTSDEERDGQRSLCTPSLSMRKLMANIAGERMDESESLHGLRERSSRSLMSDDNGLNSLRSLASVELRSMRSLKSVDETSSSTTSPDASSAIDRRSQFGALRSLSSRIRLGMDSEAAATTSSRALHLDERSVSSSSRRRNRRRRNVNNGPRGAGLASSASQRGAWEMGRMASVRTVVGSIEQLSWKGRETKAASGGGGGSDNGSRRNSSSSSGSGGGAAAAGGGSDRSMTVVREDILAWGGGGDEVAGTSVVESI